MRIIQLDPAHLPEKRMTVTEDSFAVWQALPSTTEDGAFSVTLRREPSAKTARFSNYTLFDPARGETGVWGLLEPNELRGVLEVQTRPDGTMQVCMLCVFEGFRRRGYGTLLAAKAKEIARRSGCERLCFSVRSVSSGGVAFLLSQGMTFSGCDLYAPCPEDPGRTEPLLFFTLSLR